MIAALDLGLAPLNQFAVNCLAVVGGFITGYVLSALLYNLVDRSLFRRKTPPFAHRGIRFIGGVIVALFVAYFVFANGPGGTSTGGGDGRSIEPANAQPISATISNPADSSGTAPTSVRIRVTILGGADVLAQKFYLVDDDATPRTLAEVKAFAVKKKEGTSTRLTLEIRHAKKNALPADHPAVLMLERIAREVGLGTDFPEGR